MNLTKKQRREIYLKAAEVVYTWKYFYLCGILKDILVGKEDDFDNGNYKCDGTLPEFDLFEPIKGECNVTSLWWLEDDEYDVRSTCMLLCAEMCK